VLLGQRVRDEAERVGPLEHGGGERSRLVRLAGARPDLARSEAPDRLDHQPLLVARLEVDHASASLREELGIIHDSQRDVHPTPSLGRVAPAAARGVDEASLP